MTYLCQTISEIFHSFSANWVIHSGLREKHNTSTDSGARTIFWPDQSAGILSQLATFFLCQPPKAWDGQSKSEQSSPIERLLSGTQWIKLSGSGRNTTVW